MLICGEMTTKPVLGFRSTRVGVGIAAVGQGAEAVGSGAAIGGETVAAAVVDAEFTGLITLGVFENEMEAAVVEGFVAVARVVAPVLAAFDEELGPHTRRWAYAHALGERRLLRRMMSRDVPWIEACLLPLLMPRVVAIVRDRLQITPESTQRSIEIVRRIFAEVGERLGDGRQFLVDNRFTAADLTFAALAAPVLFPAGYRAAYPALDEVPASMRAEVLRLRDTDAGKFALRLFAQERDRT